MATTIKSTKYFYPPRPGSGSATFSDNIVGLQLVDGGGLTQGNFEFTTGVVDKVNRTFGVGAFSAPVNLADLNIESLSQSKLISEQFKVYPNYDISQVLNFSLYGSLSKRFSVSITNIINYFPASLDVLFTTLNFSTGNTAVNILYDSVNDETYFEVNVDRIHNPFGIDYTASAATNLAASTTEISPYRNLYNTYLDYAISINDVEYKVNSFLPAQSFTTGYIAFYVSGSPFGNTSTATTNSFQIRPNDFIVDKVFSESFDEIEKFLLNRLVQPIYTAVFQVPAQNNYGQFYVDYQQVTWPRDGDWNLDIRSFLFEDYLTQLQLIAENLDSFKTNLISRFLTAGSLKEFDTIGRKVEKVFQIYGRSFDEIKKYIDGLSFANSVNYNPLNDLPSELLSDLTYTLGWGANFSPITNENYLSSVFGNQQKPNYPGYAKALTPTELNYAFYRSLILNSSYVFKSKGTRRSVEFLLNLIGAPESLVEYNEHVYLADQKIDLENFQKQFAKISGGTQVIETPAYDPGNTFKINGIEFTAFTTVNEFRDVIVNESDYPMDAQGFPYAPLDTDSVFFQKGAGWYEQTPSHRSPEELVITGNVFTGQNTSIQTQLKPFSYGQEYLNVFRKFPYINDGFKLTKIIDNNKSWLSDDNNLRISNQANYNAYYYTDDEKLVLNVKNIDLFLNPGQGLSYEIWEQSRRYDYPIPESGLTEYYPVPGGVDSTFVNPQPKKKTFFEFSQTFWQNMINTRNRLFITDGKTGGYPTLQSLWWKYIQQYENIGIQNYQYTYQKLISYVIGMGPYWLKLVEQMIPATTIWQGGIRYENSILHRQKFVYRRNRECEIRSSLLPRGGKGVPGSFKPGANPLTIPFSITTNATEYTANNQFLQIFIYPWLNGDTSVSNFMGILNNRVNSLLESNGYTITTCNNINSLVSEWYMELKIDNQVLIKEKFYTGYGPNDAPTNTNWKTTLYNYLPNVVTYGLNYSIEGEKLKISNLGNNQNFVNQNLTLNVGINLNLTC
jgi:hypothetical protein